MKIKIIKSKNNYQFVIVGRNGKPICTSGKYANKRNAKESAKLVRAQLGSSSIIEAP